MSEPLQRRTIVWGLALGGLGVGLCWVPLFDLLGYEFCFALGLAASFAGAHLGAQTVWETRRRASRSDGEGADASSLRAIGRLWWRATARTWLLLVVPLVAITLNALRVRNCDYSGGLAWFVLLPVSSAACGTAAGVTVALFGAHRRQVTPTLLAVAVVLGSILWAAWRFYAAPPIFAYDPFGGYFPGTPYDEEVAIAAPFLWARLYHALVALAFLLGCAAFLDGPRLALRWRARRGGLLALTLLAIFGAHLLAHHAPHLGFRFTARDIQEALGSERTTPHFVLHYSSGGPWAKDIELHAEDHELRYAQLQKLLGTEPATRVHAYLFDSVAQKHALMGAAHTFVAKPWRREIYLQPDGWPHPVMMHELAHVFAGRFGDPLFGASRRGLAFNVGLIEGVAVAAAWQATPLTPHQAVKSMRLAHIEPPLEQVMSVRFLGLNASQAYNVAGSFCRFLLERYGAAPLEAVFRAAGGDGSWEAAYGKSLGALAAEWSAFIDGVALPERESELLRERLRRPSVLHKVCAHELAIVRDDARRLQAAGDRVGALERLESVCADDPDEPQNLADVMDAAHTAERPDEARRAAARLLAHPKVTDPERARAQALLGDLALEAGDLAAARTAYTAAAALPLDEATARLVTVKLLAANEPPGPVADGLRRFLAAPQATRDPGLDLLTLSQLVQAQPDRALFQYLLARQLETRGRYAEAAAALDRALARPDELPDARFVREALRLLGRSAFRAGDRARAKAAFYKLAADPTDAARLEAADWLARADFVAP